MVLAMAFPRPPLLHRSDNPPASAPSPSRNHRSACHPPCRQCRRYLQARESPHPTPFLRDSSARIRFRRPHHPTVARPQRRCHHHDLRPACPTGRTPPPESPRPRRLVTNAPATLRALDSVLDGFHDPANLRERALPVKLEALQPTQSTVTVISEACEKLCNGQGYRLI